MKKILIPTKLSKLAKEILEENGFLVVQNTKKSINELVDENQDTIGLIVRSEKVTAEIIDKLPQLKVIIRAGAGYNTIDIQYARSKEIAVMNTPGSNANAVVEEVILLILASYRHLIQADSSVRQGLWEKSKFMGKEITHKKIGILGFGAIGQLLVKRLAGFDNSFYVFDPFISKEKLENFKNITLCSMEEIFKQSDIISLHIPATKETNKMVNKKLFSLMKDNSVLINCSRSEVLNEDDLREIKKTKNIIFCNDVYPKDEAGEKPIKDIADIMLPHLGASTLEANTKAAERSAKQLIDYLKKGVDIFVVNKLIPKGLKKHFQILAYSIAKIAKSYHNELVGTYKLEFSFYGVLKEYYKYLVPHAVSALTGEISVFDSYEQVLNYAKEQGVELVIREIDKQKDYDDSITIDLTQENKSTSKVSIRGTLVDNNIVISRINEFDKLYFTTKGYNLIFIYKDKKGTLAKITEKLSQYLVNIEDIKCPHNAQSDNSIAIIKLDKKLSKEQLQELGTSFKSKKLFSFSL